MLRRIIAIVKRDFDNSIRDNLLLYGLLTPVLMALIMRFFTPSVEDSAITFAVLESMDQATVQQLSQYASIATFKTEQELMDRVNDLDETVGILMTESSGQSQFELVFEGNETHDANELSKAVIQTINQGDRLANVQQTDLGKTSNIKEYMASFLALGSMLIGGMLIGLNIIDEKEEDTIRALSVTPLKRSEFVLARSIFGVVLSVVLVYLGLWVLGVQPLPYSQVLFITMTGIILTVLFGFFLGSVSNNQINGIANLKFGALIFLLPAVGTFVVPQAYTFILYIFPTYWTFEGYKAIFLNQESWDVLKNIGLWSMLTNLAFLAIMYPLLKNKLSFGRD